MFDYNKKIYVSEEVFNNILHEKWKYVFFDVSECTEDALEEKCKRIMRNQHVDWQPLVLEHKTNINVYTKTYYYKK